MMLVCYDNNTVVGHYSNDIILLLEQLKIPPTVVGHHINDVS